MSTAEHEHISMHQQPAAPSEPASAPTPTPLTITIIDQSERDTFDTNFRTATGMLTPLPPASDAFVATDPITGDVLGVSYIHIRHLMGPYALAVTAPPDTLTRISHAITDQLRATVRESLMATHADGPVPMDVGLSYDVYVLEGQPAPEGFERLGVEVWRRRVC